MKKYYITVILFLICNTLAVVAQNGQMYTQYNGLSNSHINTICYDNKGFICLATNYGLNRFDGLQLKTFNISDNESSIIRTNRFSDICLDKQGRLWLGTQNGFYYFNRKKKTIELLVIQGFKFRVMALFDSSFANYTDKELTVIINPPHWSSWWAKSLYVLIIGFLICFVSWRVSQRIKIKEELQKQKYAVEILEAQLISFTNVSHEIRTPLTIIIGLLKRLIRGEEQNPVQLYHSMMSNSKKIMDLMNQILDVHVLDTGSLKLHFDQINIVDYIKEIVDSFQFLANESSISISLETDNEKLNVITDPEAFSKIICNLMSNAIKFTPNGGRVSVSVKQDAQSNFSVSVTDTGIGIRKEKLNGVFERFYRGDNTSNSQSGFGIGLHLVKSLVELMNGEVSVSSKLGEGTCFVVTLPIIGKSSLSYEQLPSENQNILISGKSKPLVKSKYKIVIVEDNIDVRNFISNELENYYKVVLFTLAKDAYKYVLDNSECLIISDIMMPEVDGFKFCKMLKSNPKTIDIPIILLTARADHQAHIKGIEEGADAYITKPFMIEVLLATIQNLIKVRKTIINKYSRNYEIGQSKKIEQYKTLDDKLIEQFIAIVKEQINNPELSIEMLSLELGVSRANLFRKVKGLTNQTPSTFVRNIRLEQAAVLLKKNVPSSEAAFFVGFNSHSYFSKLFHEYYGCSPSEYILTNSEGNNDFHFYAK